MAEGIKSRRAVKVWDGMSAPQAMETVLHEMVHAVHGENKHPHGLEYRNLLWVATMDLGWIPEGVHVPMVNGRMSQLDAAIVACMRADQGSIKSPAGVPPVVIVPWRNRKIAVAILVNEGVYELDADPEYLEDEFRVIDTVKAALPHGFQVKLNGRKVLFELGGEAEDDGASEGEGDIDIQDLDDDGAKRLIATIVKMLALADDQKGTPEGELALKRARERMVKYRIEEADLYKDDGGDSIGEHQFDVPRRQPWCRKLAHELAYHSGCFSLATGDTMELFGRREAVVVAEHLYVFVARCLENAADTHIQELKTTGQWEALSPTGKRHKRRRFLQSAVDVVTSRLKRMRHEEQQQEPQGYELMKSDVAAAEQWAKDQGNKWVSRRGADAEFDPDGHEAGQNVPLQEAVEGRRASRRGGWLLTG